ncbi:cobyric acid synthase [Collinsella sp. AF14-35]|nr:cobyric acid synthase [Collinsella sp. AF14-35]
MAEAWRRRSIPVGRAKPIMIQGTMSNAGKSLLAAGLCRVLSQDGLRVTPFKSQNMALNSGVTADGLEMGRAQIMQAEACGIAPDVRMNPILLKPESGHRSQLIVAGKAQGAFAARDYFARKKALMPQILEAFDSLAEENDVIVIEGAGSPAEINLAENDIVNMGLARAVSSPVLLAGDIDSGGVFAQLYGTVALLAPEDRALLRGLVVNKFRGDVEILRPGLAPLEKMCGVPVVGVVPYLTLDLDDEDSLAPRLSAREARGVIDVAVVRLPHLSNFTDFDPLSRVPGVGVRYVSSTTDLGRPDLVVLPGSKTTLDDARWLAASGIGACVRALSGAGTPVLGICGGYQLLGDELSDPHGREGAGTARGLGLIPASTVFKEEKRLAQSELRITGAQGAFSAWNGMTARGYEIHDGETTVSCAPAGTIGGKPEGAACGNVFGTYLHGLFDEPGVALALARSLARMRGLPESVVGAAGAASAADHRAREFDRLADVVRGALDMEYVYRIIEEGV